MGQGNEGGDLNEVRGMRAESGENMYVWCLRLEDPCLTPLQMEQAREGEDLMDWYLGIISHAYIHLIRRCIFI